MLPGYVAGAYTYEECHIDLVRLCSFAGVRLIQATASGLDHSKKFVHLADNRPPIHYDVLSINIGITPKAFPNSFNTNTLSKITAVKPINSFALRWDDVLSRLVHDTQSRQHRICIVGGGAGGVELTFAIHYRVQTELQKINSLSEAKVKVTLVSTGRRLLSSHNK